MRDVNREAYFDFKKVFTNGFATKNAVQEVLTHWFSGKEKGRGAAVSKEYHTESLLGHERTHQYWLPWKRCIFK